MRKEVKIGGIKLDNVVFTETGENYIFAEDYKEDFFGIYNVTILKENFLCKHIKRDYVEVKVSIDENVYERVIFKLVKEGKEGLVINLNSLDVPYVPSQVSIIQEKSEPEVSFKEPKNNEIDALIDYKIKRKDLIIEKLQKEIKEIKNKSKEQREYKKEELLNFFKENINKGIDQYKESLVEDVLKIHQQYEDSFNDRVFNLSNEISSQITKNIKDEYEENLYNQGLLLFTEKLNKEKEEITNLFSNEIKEKISNFSITFKENSNKLIEDSFIQYKKLIEKLEEDIKDKTLIIDEKIKNFDKEGKFKKSIVQQVLDQTKKYTDTKVATTTQDVMRYARILLDYAGGGGSVAVQHAKGGDMHGDLNIYGNLSVTNEILSGNNNINLLKIFAGEGEGDDNPIDGGIF